jgi:hypothetical protein
MTPFSVAGKTPMAHKANRLMTAAETAPFIRQAAKLWTEDDRSVFVDFIAANPDAGDVINHGVKDVIMCKRLSSSEFQGF